MLRLMKLEDRIVLDAAGAGAALDHADAVEAHGVDADVHVASQDHDMSPVVAEAAALIAEPDISGTRLDIVLVADDVADYSTLVAAVHPDAKVLVYDADTVTAEDLAEEVASIARDAGRSVDSLTILSHGGSGYFRLGKDMVTAESLADNQAAWETLDAAMSDDGHVFIYGCNVTGDAATGESLIQGLAQATGTTVHASTDVTGHGGDWDLESASGDHADDAVTPPLDTEALAAYSGTLTTSLPLAITTLEDNPGSYRIFIYGPGENSTSQTASSVQLTEYDEAVLGNVTLRYDGWITDQPREIDGVMVTEYHRWSVDYDPVKDINGQTTLDFTVNGTAMETTITLLPVNDAPEFTKGLDLVVPKDSGTQTFDTWATDIRPGPVTATDEAGQALQFFVTNDANSLFSVQPTLSVDGTLTFTPAPGAVGVATVSVYLKDDGGTAFGGQDTSPIQTFTITIAAPTAYVENSAAVPVYAQADISLGGNATVTGAVIKITDQYQNNAGSSTAAYQGQDVLDATVSGNIQKSWDAATGTLTLSGSATAAEYEAALKSVSFVHTGGVTGQGDDPIESHRTVSIAIQTGGRTAEMGTIEVAVDAVNDAPQLTPVTGTFTYNEDSGAKPIDPTFTLTDVDDERMTGAVVRITEGYQAGVDKLAYGGTGAITAVWDAATATLTLSGVASKADYQAALRAVTFENASQSPTDVTRTVTFTVTDANSRGVGDGPSGTGGAASATAIRTVTVNDLPDPPTNPIDTKLDAIYEDNQAPTNGQWIDTDGDGEYNKTYTGTKVSGLVEGATDPDTGAEVNSMAITAVDATNGKWYYTLNSNPTQLSDWTAIDTASLNSGNMLLLPGTASILFVPNKDFNTERAANNATPSITFRAWDEGLGTSGTYALMASVANAVSPTTAKATIAVNAVNDAPNLAGVPTDTQKLNSSQKLTLTGISVSDVDVAEGPNKDLTVTLSVANGTITLGNTSGVTIVGGANGTNTVTVQGTLSSVNSVISSITYSANTAKMDAFVKSNDPAKDVFDTLTIEANDLGHFGVPGARKDTETVSIMLGNTGPVIDLDPDDDGGGDPPVGPDTPNNDKTFDFNVYFIEDSRCTPVFIADTKDPAPLVTDREGDDIISMEIRLTNPQDGDSLAASVAGTGLTITKNGIDAATGALVLRIEGTASTSVYDSVLRSVTYDNSSQNPSAVRRIIEVTATDDNGLGGNVATSRVSVVPVNDKPVNELNGVPIADTPSSIFASTNQPVTFSLSVDDADLDPDTTATLTEQISVKLDVEFGTLTVQGQSNALVTNNGTSVVTIVGSFSDVNAAIASVTYTPVEGFSGTDTLTMTTNDHGNTGVHPGTVSSVNGLCVVADGILDPNGGIIPNVNDGTPNAPSALTDVDKIPIVVVQSDIDVIPEPPVTPDVPTPPIVRPEGEHQNGLGPGIVNLPRNIGLTGGASLTNIAGAFMAGDKELVRTFCSIEEALRTHLGCRVASTADPEARFSAIEWNWMENELGWTPPYRYLDEEWDLYSQLFLRHEGDPGFNVPPHDLGGEDLGGLPDNIQPVMNDAPNGPTFNDMAPGDMKQAFFAGRERLDRTGR